MNRDWMRERLESFEALCEEYNAEIAPDREQKVWAEMAAQEPTVKQILKRLDPELVSLVTDPGYTTRAYDSQRAVQMGLGILRDQEEWAANLAPDAPSLVADQFHPDVWTAASDIWDTGRYRVAVQQAAVSLSAHIAAKAGSPLTERALVSQVFSKDDPRPGQARLHMPGDKSTETWRSRQEGLHLIAQGAFAGIRNVATHTADEWTEQVALEHLAVLSVVAKWTDETVPVTAS